MLAFSIFSFTACGFDSANIDVTENEQEVAQDNSVEKSEEIAERVDNLEEETEEIIYAYTDFDKTMYCICNCSIKDLPSRDGNVVGKSKMVLNMQS